MGKYKVNQNITIDMNVLSQHITSSGGNKNVNNVIYKAIKDITQHNTVEAVVTRVSEKGGVVKEINVSGYSLNIERMLGEGYVMFNIADIERGIVEIMDRELPPSTVLELAREIDSIETQIKTLEERLLETKAELKSLL